MTVWAVGGVVVCECVIVCVCVSERRQYIQLIVCQKAFEATSTATWAAPSHMIFNFRSSSCDKSYKNSFYSFRKSVKSETLVLQNNSMPLFYSSK